MSGIQWVVRNDEQLGYLIGYLKGTPYPYQIKVSKVHHPKTTQQIRYAHSLCGALAKAKGANPEHAKKDCKAEFGVVVVDTSLVTGQRNARLVSFADYSREQMEAFCTAMEAHLSENNIDFVGAD